MRGIATICLGLGVASCGNDDVSRPVSVVEEMRGDTVVLTSSGASPQSTLDSVEILWRSDQLGVPSTMALVNGSLVIGDGDRVHIVPVDGGEVDSFGGSGSGPGEFQRIAAVGPFGIDTVAVFDGRLQRVSLFTLDGEFLDSQLVRRDEEFVNPARRGPPLVRHGDGVLLLMEENVPSDRPRRLGLVWHNLNADTSRVLEAWEDERFVELVPGVVGSRDLFPARAIVSIGQGGLVVHGDGLSYCLSLTHVSEGPPRVIGRDRPAVRITGDLRLPEVDTSDADQMTQLSQRARQAQNIGEYLPHFDRILVGEGGELWVRTLHDELATMHPTQWSPLADTHPVVREWEVFDTEGRLRASVRIPIEFEVRAATDDYVYGFWTFETGEMAIAAIGL